MNLSNNILSKYALMMLTACRYLLLDKSKEKHQNLCTPFYFFLEIFFLIPDKVLEMAAIANRHT